jgi:membrane-associated phospholipid phosphatase
VLRSDPEDANSGLRWTAFAIAETSIVVTGALRVGAHAHSWEDVVAGAILGHAAGALIAFVHPEEPLDLATKDARESAAGSALRERRGPGLPLAFAWGTEF